MRTWFIFSLKAAAVFFVPGALAVGIACVVRARRRAQAVEQKVEESRRFHYVTGMERHDDSLRIQSNQRRAVAEQARREAVQIESGGESEQRRKLRLA